MSEQGLAVDQNNMLVSDVMTNTGAIQAIGRHGISGAKVSVLARAFEITSTHLLQAGLSGSLTFLPVLLKTSLLDSRSPRYWGCSAI